MEKSKLKSVLESLLFVSGEPIKIAKLAKIIEVEKKEIVEAITEISKEYQENERGLMILENGDELQLVSNEKNTQYVEKLVKNELEGPLSTAALEVVSIIAYRSPVSKSEIEAIRGVNCSYTLRSLSMRGLIERENNPKDSRGYVYAVSFDFLKKLGIENVKNLPKYDILSKDEKINSIIEKQ